MNWKNLNWSDIQGKLYLIQRNVYDQTKNGNLVEVKRLQDLILEDKFFKFLAVKRVTVDNKGRKTAGVDGIKSLSPIERYDLGRNLILDGKASPVLRVWIPKPGTEEKRPLGIPTIIDRAKQALTRFALEPQMEALFESHSYGFRPGRKANDATWLIRHKLKYGSMWVYDADIKKCFDRISHTTLIDKISTSTSVKNQIKAWLEAGIFEKGEAFPPQGIGTPQGGVISPLLANIALDGAQKKIWDDIYKDTGNKKNANKVLFIRYADDFVIISPEKKWLDTAIKTVKIHLAEMGLEINNLKTRTIHTSKPPFQGKEKITEEDYSFNFLGFNFSQRKISRYKTVKLGGGKGETNLVPVVLPMKKKIKSVFSKITKAFGKSRKALDLIKELNPLIRGWRNFYKSSDSRTYGSLPGLWDKRLNIKCRHWIKRNHNKYGRNQKYWTSIKGDNWVFYADDIIRKKRVFMEKFSWVSWSLQSVNRIISTRSPYDGDIAYWSLHSGSRTMGVSSPKREYLLKIQKGICLLCKKPFTPENLPFSEIDHIKERIKGGGESWGNSRLLHKECHLNRQK
jgi:RNA-directed DNA polymerase